MGCVFFTIVKCFLQSQPRFESNPLFVALVHSLLRLWVTGMAGRRQALELPTIWHSLGQPQRIEEKIEVKPIALVRMFSLYSASLRIFGLAFSESPNFKRLGQPPPLLLTEWLLICGVLC